MLNLFKATSFLSLAPHCQLFVYAFMLVRLFWWVVSKWHANFIKWQILESFHNFASSLHNPCMAIHISPHIVIPWLRTTHLKLQQNESYYFITHPNFLLTMVTFQTYYRNSWSWISYLQVTNRHFNSNLPTSRIMLLHIKEFNPNLIMELFICNHWHLKHYTKHIESWRALIFISYELIQIILRLVALIFIINNVNYIL